VLDDSGVAVLDVGQLLRGPSGCAGPRVRAAKGHRRQQQLQRELLFRHTCLRVDM
jgi:hypothetical protein